MKKYFIFFFILIVLHPLNAQKSDSLRRSAAPSVSSVLSRHMVSADAGSIRNRYFYPITDIAYHSPIEGKTGLRFSARLRSYGSLFFFSRSAYDITPLAEYFFMKGAAPLCFSAGAGLDARLRLVKDDRSTAASSAEPLLSLAMHVQFRKLSLSLPYWTRFYSNGISFSILPEISYTTGNHFSLFLRYETSYLGIYHEQSHEWRRDAFMGAHFAF